MIYQTQFFCDLLRSETICTSRPIDVAVNSVPKFLETLLSILVLIYTQHTRHNSILKVLELEETIFTDRLALWDQYVSNHFQIPDPFPRWYNLHII